MQTFRTISSCSHPREDGDPKIDRELSVDSRRSLSRALTRDGNDRKRQGNDRKKSEN